MNDTRRDSTLAFIGAGVMGEAMIGGLVGQHLVAPEAVVASDHRAVRGAELASRFGIRTTTDNAAAVRDAQIVVLAVKPQVLRVVFRELHGTIPSSALVLSIVAGARIDSIASGLGHPAIVRSMPNTPARVGEGMTVWTATPVVSGAQRAQALTILAALGHELHVDDETFLDMATAISGTGPAYVFLFMEALITRRSTWDSRVTMRGIWCSRPSAARPPLRSSPACIRPRCATR